jgi:phosphoenolpyruvate carboxykinase (ATP)
VFRVAVPTEVPGVPSQVLVPRDTWSDPAAYDTAARKIAHMFHANFAAYEDGVSKEIREAGPIGPDDVGAMRLTGPGEG